MNRSVSTFYFDASAIDLSRQLFKNVLLPAPVTPKHATRGSVRLSQQRCVKSNGIVVGARGGSCKASVEALRAYRKSGQKSSSRVAVRILQGINLVRSKK